MIFRCPQVTLFENTGQKMVLYQTGKNDCSLLTHNLLWMYKNFECNWSSQNWLFFNVIMSSHIMKCNNFCGCYNFLSSFWTFSLLWYFEVIFFMLSLLLSFVNVIVFLSFFFIILCYNFSPFLVLLGSHRMTSRPVSLLLYSIMYLFIFYLSICLSPCAKIYFLLNINTSFVMNGWRLFLPVCKNNVRNVTLGTAG